MKKTLFILGSIEALSGTLLWSVADMIKNIMPLWGRVAYQAAAQGSYTTYDYVFDASLPTALAFVLIAVGVAQIALSVVRKEK